MSKGKEYKYFVAYTVPNGNGNIEITRGSMISNIGDVKSIQDLLESDFGMKDPVISNWILLSGNN